MDAIRGTQLDDGVLLYEQLSAGAGEHRWLGHHERLSVPVLVRISTARSPGARALAEERFRREASASDCLDSPHVTRVLGQGKTEDGAPYLCTELLDGETLAERLVRGPLPIRELLDVVQQSAQVLDAAHGRGILHGDVEPGHVFLLAAPRGRTVVKIGLATTQEDVDAPHVEEALAGVPPQLEIAYVCRDLLLDPRDLGPGIDLWSLAAVAYEGLTGTAAFRGPSPQAIAATILDLRFVPPSALRRELDAECDAFFELALHREKGPRPRSGAALAADLRDALSTALAAPATTETSAALAESALAPHRAAMEAWVAALREQQRGPSRAAREALARGAPEDEAFVHREQQTIDSSPPSDAAPYPSTHAPPDARSGPAQAASGRSGPGTRATRSDERPR